MTLYRSNATTRFVLFVFTFIMTMPSFRYRLRRQTGIHLNVADLG